MPSNTRLADRRKPAMQTGSSPSDRRRWKTLYACLMTGWATLRTRTPPGVRPRSVPCVRVPVQGQRRRRRVDRLPEQVRARGTGRSPAARRPACPAPARSGSAPPARRSRARAAPRRAGRRSPSVVPHEGLHLRLAEVAGARARRTRRRSPSTPATPSRRAGAVEHGAVALQHGDAGVGRARATTCGTWSQWWSWLPSTATTGTPSPPNSVATQRASASVPCRVRSPASSSTSAALGQLLQGRPEPADHVLVEVHVADGGDPDHEQLLRLGRRLRPGDADVARRSARPGSAR